MIKSLSEFIRLRTSTAQSEYARAASDTIAAEVWPELIRNDDMKIWAVRNKNVPSAVLEELAGDTNRDVRLAVAMKRKLTPKLFELLSRDPDSAVRMAIATNRSTPAGVLRYLLHDPWQGIVKEARRRLESIGSETLSSVQPTE